MLSHEGQYTCVVTNSAGEDKRDFHVTIQGTLAEIGASFLRHLNSCFNSDVHVDFSSQFLRSFTGSRTERRRGVSDTRATIKTTRWRNWTWSLATRSVCPVRVMPFPHPSSAGTKTGRNSYLAMEWSFSPVGRTFLFTGPVVCRFLKGGYLFRRTGATNCSSAERRRWKVHMSGCE